MRRWLVLLIGLVVLSCNNEGVLQLPEVENAEITEVLDVSPAYIFYDETQPDSTLFNRKNLIGTTNWLVNVDKRLTLEQAIPHIQYLQNKREKASIHKNENAKNYFTCNDTSIQNLGFVEFTDIKYLSKRFAEYRSLLSSVPINNIVLEFKKIDDIYIYGFLEKPISKKTSIVFLESELLKILNSSRFSNIILSLELKNDLTFQNYVTIKRKLQTIKSDVFIIDSKEFIY